MANLQIVETSLRDGNQCLWGALGVTTANTLTIAPAMERAGYRAIDFTTSTHMGVAVRYKQEDPWERIRAMAEICGNTPLQFLSTGFRFIAWETASPEFMELAFRTLARNGIRRFALADPNNDAESNVEVAKLVRRGGGERGHRCALHQGSRRASVSSPRANSDPRDHGRDRRQAARAAQPLHDR